MAFLMNLQNFWRFPREAYLKGQGAFVWAYIITMVSIGSCLLFFEIALGQSYNMGCTKAFSICPIFEGLSVVMAIYCTMLVIYYNVINVVTFLYFIASFAPDYATCDFNTSKNNVCLHGSSNQTLTPEYAYFKYHILYYSVRDYSKQLGFLEINWKNAVLLFCLWILIAIAILRSVNTLKWPPKYYCPLPFITFGMTLFFSLFTKGASDGLGFMFQCTMQDLSNLTVWRSSVEQAIVSLGIGMGPVITLGSILKLPTSSDRDSFFIVILVGMVTILSGSIVFCTAGILAAERNQDIQTVLHLNETYTRDIHVHVVFSQLFTRISPPWSSIISLLFFFTLFIAGWYPLITYLQSAILICYSYIPCLIKYKSFTELGFCLICFMSGLVLVTPGGYYSIIFFDELLVTITVILIVICELCAVIYVNGLYDFSDDIEFMTGFEPNFYIKLIWIFFPWALLGLLSMFIDETNLEDMVLYEKIAGLAGLLIVFTPLALVAFYNIYICYKEGDILKVFRRREVAFEPDNVNNTGKSVPWFRKLENVAGPSHIS